MNIRNNTRLKITNDLLILEKGRDELLLANCMDLQPLYINKGRDYIKYFLKAASELGTYKKILDVFPQEDGLLTILLNHGIIIPIIPKKENILNNQSEEINYSNKKRMSLYLLLSQSCNMGCIYCLNGTITYQTYRNLRMTKEIAFRSIERCLDDLCQKGELEIVFFGGEPLLNWPLAKDIIIHCESFLKEKYPEKKIKYHLTSNLSFLPVDLIEWAKKYSITFLCDIDGPGEIHDMCRPLKDGRPSHEIILRNIKRIISSGLEVALRATITAINQDHLVEVSEHHKQIGGKSSAFVPVNPVNSDENIIMEELLPSPQKIIRELIKLYKSKIWKKEELFPFNQYSPRLIPGSRTVLGCGAPYGNTPTVDVNGNVYPCIYLVGIERFFMGNIMSYSYPDRKILKWMHEFLVVDHIDDCKSCSWRYICGGGCPVGKLTVLNNPKVTSKVIKYCKQINCTTTKKYMELLLWEKAKEVASIITEDIGNHGTISIKDQTYC